MKKALAGVMAILGMACGASAQNGASVRTNTAEDLSESSASQVTLLAPAANDFSLATPAGAPSAEAAPAPAAPAATPKYVVFGDRDDYRWQLGVGVDFVHFNSSVFDSNMVGLNTTLTYFTNSWFGVEGSIITAFGGQTFNSPDHAKMFGGAGGIRIGSRRARWEPFAHALVGGAHLQPETAYQNRTSIMAVAGGGVDFRMHARLSIRGEADYLYTGYFNQTQNNVQVVGGVVFHF
jgi:opacity protein-like surface antigen